MAKKRAGNRGEMYGRVYEKENILYILRKTKEAVITKNVFELKELSNRTIHNASHYQDTDSLAVAVLVYAIGKIVERSKYTEYKEWPSFERAILSGLDKAVFDLENDKVEKFREDMGALKEAINKLSGHLKKYVEEVFRKAMINKASRIYEHGISLEQTASLLGISLFELAEYAGKTGISDVNLGVTMPIQKRLKNAEKLLG